MYSSGGWKISRYPVATLVSPSIGKLGNVVNGGGHDDEQQEAGGDHAHH